MRRDFPATVPVRRVLRAFVERCTVQYELKGPFLDLGAGYRSNEPEICAKVLHDYYTLDINPLLSPDFVADAHDLSFLPQGAFGAVLCTELLEHVRDPQRVSAEIGRMLKPGAHVIVSVPFSVPIHRKPPYQEDYWRFTPDGVCMLFREYRLIEMELTGDVDQPVGIFCIFGA